MAQEKEQMIIRQPVDLKEELQQEADRRGMEKPYFDTFLERHPNFPLVISVAALIASCRKEIYWFIDWILGQL